MLSKILKIVLITPVFMAGVFVFYVQTPKKKNKTNKKVLTSKKNSKKGKVFSKFIPHLNKMSRNPFS